MIKISCSSIHYNFNFSVAELKIKFHPFTYTVIFQAQYLKAFKIKRRKPNALIFMIAVVLFT